MRGSCREFVAKYGSPKYADQDILNAVLCNEAGLLPACLDVLIPTPENMPECVLHLTGVGRRFSKSYDGNIIQYRYWESVANSTPFGKSCALPFYVRNWMIRL